jgi:diguanylate cyclase (GGDEF)-like protein
MGLDGRFDRSLLAWMAVALRTRLARLSSGRRLFLVGIVLVTAITVGIGLIIRMERESAINDYVTAETNLANGMIRQTDHAISPVLQALTDVPHKLAAVAPGKTGTRGPSLGSRAARDLLTGLQKSLNGIEALALIDANGRLANAAPSWPSSQPNPSGQDYFLHLSAIDDETVYVGVPTKDPATGRWSSVLAARIDDAHGQFLGIVAARWSLTDLEDFYRVAMPPGRTLTVLRRDGTVLARYPHWDEVMGIQVPPESPWHDAVAHGGGSYHGPGLLGTPPVVAAIRPMPELPLIIAAAGTEMEALADWRKQRTVLILGGLAADVGIVLLLYFIGAQFRRLELSEQSLAQKNSELDNARQQLSAALSNIVQGVGFFSAEGKLLVCNARYQEIYKLPSFAVTPGTAFADIIDLCIASGSFPDMTCEEHLRAHAAIMRTGKLHHVICDFMDGRTIAMQKMPLAGGAWVATHEDVTERRRADDKIVYLARHDVLTGLANRASFEELIVAALADAEGGDAFAVMFLDLDRFKLVNDTLGHQVGDDLLRAVAHRLRTSVRESDVVARFGGDEFVILQRDFPTPDAPASLAERILDAFAKPFDVGGHQLVAATSIGIAIAPIEGGSADTLLKNADLALYVAKQEGRGTYRFFEPAMDAKAQLRHALEMELRTALAQEEFDVFYHPVVDLRYGRANTVEALLRWQHPERGIVAPSDFVPIAEECGLIVQIGEWVLRRACREAVTWPDNIRVAVNLSPVQFRDGNLVAKVATILAESGLPATRLELEVTETVLLAHNAANLGTLHELRDMGVRIAMDDFGIGYSSLSHLRHFPFDKIKIDQSFIKEITTRKDVLMMVRAILGLCLDLGIRATVEGVETAEQLKLLIAEGCTEVQGYLFSRPLPPDDLVTLLHSGPLTPAQPPQTTPDAALRVS